jgi:hypothetical protein
VSPFVLRIVFSIFYQVVQQKRQSQPSSAQEAGGKYGQTSEVLFNEALHLLLLALQWRTNDTHGRATDMSDASKHRRSTLRAAAINDLQFSARSEDLALNLCQQFVIGDAGEEEHAKSDDAQEKGKEKEDMEVVAAEGATAIEPESILRFLVELAEEGEGLFDEHRDVLQTILTLAAKCDDSGETTCFLQELRYAQFRVLMRIWYM